MKKKATIYLKYLCVCIIFAGSFFSARCIAAYNSAQTKNKPFTIVIDAGHGGADPGKVGLNNTLEKNINLEIALKLGKLLEKKGYNIIYTRTEDCDLAPAGSHRRKTEDLQNRIKLIEESNSDLTICIHQNSFPDESVKGPQVFYYSSSDESEKLASIVQTKIDEELNIEKSRGIKNNINYYLLKKSPKPTIIVECGFLSNPTESKLLANETYQNKIARAIYLGTNEYIKRK